MTTSPQDRQQSTAKLDGFSAAALLRIGAALGVGLPSRDRATVLAVLGAFIGTPAHHDALLRRFQPTDWSLLNLLLWRMEPVSLLDVRAHATEAGAEESDRVSAPIPASDMIALRLADPRRPADPEDSTWGAVARLIAHGCLVPAEGGQLRGAKLGIESGDLGYPTSAYLFERVPEVALWAAEHAPPRVALDPAPPPTLAVPAALSELQRAAYVVIAEVRAKPIRIKQSGALYEADIARMALALASGDGPRAAKRLAGEPPLFWFVLGALAEAGLVGFDGANLVAAPEAGEFLAGPAQDQCARLTAGWADSLYLDVATITTLVTHYGSGTQRPWFSPEGYSHIRWEQLAAARRFFLLALPVAVERDPFAWYRIDDLATFIFKEHPDFLFRAEPEPLYFTGYGRQAQRPLARPHYPHVARNLPGAGDEARRLYRDTDWREVEGAFVRQVLADAARWLGLVELGPGLLQPESFQLTDLGRHVLCGHPFRETHPAVAERALTVQPNFDVVVPHAAADFGLLAQLDAFAERRTVDFAATYHLAQGPFVAALDRGWTLERIVELLEGSSGESLPQNVRFTLEEWAAVHDRLTFRTGATVLEAEDEAQLDTWLQDRQLRGWLGERLGPRHVIVPSDHTDAVQKRINGLGVALAVMDNALPLEKVLRLGAPDRIRLNPSKATPYLRYRVAAMADRAATPPDGAFQVTEESVRRAVAMGWTGQALLGFLSVASRDLVPLELRVRVLGWSGAIAPARFEPLVAVRLPEGSPTWNDLQQLPGVAPLLQAVPSPALALVAPDAVDHLQDALAGYGIRFAAGSTAAAKAAPAAPEEELRSVLLKYRDDPSAVLKALRGAKLLGKIDRERY